MGIRVGHVGCLLAAHSSVRVCNKVFPQNSTGKQLNLEIPKLAPTKLSTTTDLWINTAFVQLTMFEDLKSFPKTVRACDYNVKHKAFFKAGSRFATLPSETPRGSSLWWSESVPTKKHTLGIVFALVPIWPETAALTPYTEAQCVLWSKKRLIPKPDTTYSRNNVCCSLNRDKLNRPRKWSTKRL